MSTENVFYGFILLGLFCYAMKWAFTANTSSFDRGLNELLESKGTAKNNTSMAKKHRKRLVKQTITNTADARSHHSRMRSHYRR